MSKEARLRQGTEENSGKLSEYFALGEIRQTEAYVRELKKIQNERGYVSWKDSLKLARKFSPYDPTDPHNKPFLNDLRIAFIDELGFTEEKDMNRVKIFTAVGSPLDVWHGIDAFLEIEDKNGRVSKIIGFDAKEMADSPETREHVHDKKADIVIFMKDIPDAEAESKEYDAKMGEIAKEAVQIFKTKEPVAL